MSDLSLSKERTSDVEALDAICSTVSKMVKASNTLKKSDLSFYKTTQPEYGQRIDTAANHILLHVNKMIRDMYEEEDDKDVPQLEDMEDVADDFGKVVDVIDDILEKSVSQKYIHSW